jgi:hypothetical protein
MKDTYLTNITAQISALETMPMQTLKRTWTCYFLYDPLSFQRNHMIRRIAYQIQAQAYGGLSKSVLRQLQKLAGKSDDPPQKFTLFVGTELVREHRGKRIRVRVLAEGFEYGGRRYASLSAIASEIMGCRVSGPKFFGLRERGDG